MNGFNTPLFLFLFLPIYLALYLVSGKRWKIPIGIIGSLVFYASGNLVYVPLMVALTLVNYGLAKGISAGRGQSRALVWLWAGILADIGVLVFFKLSHGIAFPLGLSYVSFQLVSYLLDVRKGTLEPESDLLKF